MREQMKALDDLEMGDLWAQALHRTPQPDPGPEPHRSPVRSRIVAAVVAIAVFLVAGAFALKAFDERKSTVGGSRPVPPANCPEALPAGAIPVVGCEQAVEHAWSMAAFASTADSAKASWRKYPGSFEGQTIPSWLITFGNAEFVEGNDGCSASGSVASYTVVVSASSGALVAFDGPPEGCSVLQQTAPLVELPSDPCTLITTDQVAAATSSNVVSSRQLTDSDMKVPGAPLPCDFQTDGPFGYVGAVSVPNDPQAFTDLVNEDPVNREIVSGVGDGAFISGGAAMVVALGDGYYSIGLQHGAGTGAEAPLRRLANDVLQNLAAAHHPLPDTIDTADERFYPPLFGRADGWVTWDSGLVEKHDAAAAWASMVPIDPGDLGSRAPAIPVETISGLPSSDSGIVIVAVATPWSGDASGLAYPAGSLDRLTLSGATQRGPQAEEPPGGYAVFDLGSESKHVSVRVFFGEATPSPVALERAQTELNRLQVPPVCPTLREEPPLSASAQVGVAGDQVTLTGRFGFELEDGTYDTQANSKMIAWWNADPTTWPQLASFATEPPPPLSSGPLVRLGDADQLGGCTATVAFTVPDVAPGIYSIVALDEGGGGGASRLGHAEFQVVS